VSETDVLPELKQIVGALLFAAKGSLSLADVRRCLRQVAEDRGGVYRDFAEVTDADILAALGILRDQVRDLRIGVQINEVAGGFRMENEVNCGPWLRALLHKGRASRLSRPALETLAVIAYRQPCTRAEIEAVRGVAVDQILRNLIDLQLIRITGRSEVPGRPWQFGTTQKFLEYFGLKNVKELPGTEELRRIEVEQEAKRNQKAEEDASATDEEPAVLLVDESVASDADSDSPPASESPEDELDSVDDSDDAEESDEDDAEEDEYDDDNEDEDEDEDEDGDEYEDDDEEDEEEFEEDGDDGDDDESDEEIDTEGDGEKN